MCVFVDVCVCVCVCVCVGVFSGLYAVHPFTGSGVPVYVADYVVSDYGTKAVMG